MLERHVIRHGSAVVRGECRSGWRITAERDQRGFVERRRHQTSWFLGDGLGCCWWGLFSSPLDKLFRANLALIADNLLDFSHLSFVHEGSLGGSAAIAAATPEISVLGTRAMRIIRRVSNVEPAPYHRRLAAGIGKINRWWDYELSVSGMFIMTSGAEPVGRDPGNHEGALIFHSCQALTPASENATHYFFSHPHNFALDDPTVTEATYQSIAAAFDEDSRMIEAQAKVLSEDPSRAFVGIVADAALTRYRRLVLAALEAERAESV